MNYPITVITRDEFITMFNLFIIKNNMPQLIEEDNYGGGNIPVYSPHLIVYSKHYPKICITLWLDGLDTRCNKRLDRWGNILHDLKIDKDIKRFIALKHIDYRYPDKSFIFEWPASDDEYLTIESDIIGYMRYRHNVIELIYRYMDVIVNKNSKYFTNKYKLK